MFLKRYPKQIFYLWLFLIIGLGGIFYLVLSGSLKSSAYQGVLDRKLILARAESSNITTFFEEFGNSIVIFGQSSRIQNQTQGVQEYLDVFIEQWSKSGVIGGIALTDKNGIVKLNSNILRTRDTGFSLADRDYYFWAKNEAKIGEYFIGRPVIGRGKATEGQLIIPVATAIYTNNRFNGVLVSSVRIDLLAHNFLELLRLSSLTNAYILNKDRGVLYGDPNLPLDIKDGLSVTVEGKFKSGKHLVAYSPLVLGDQKLVLLITTPAQEIADFTTPIYMRIAGLMLLTFLSILLFGLISVREVKTS